MGMSLRRAVVMGLGVLALAMPLAVQAGSQDSDGDDDHDVARDLHEGGEIRALSQILSDLRQQVPGDIVAVDLVRAHDKWVYRIQIVAADGKRSLVEVDAGAGTIFHDQGRD
ncbi:hypothetical protein C3941_21600 [Kaistia algarum]|nr:hypothetical protein C3941_21600 [Kaistia algarum]